MADEKGTRWDLITGVAMAAAIAAGIVVARMTEFFNGVFAVMIVSGLYLAFSFYIRDDTRGSGKISEADGPIMGGVLLFGIGVSGMLHYYIDNVTITAVSIIAFMILASAVMLIRNRELI